MKEGIVCFILCFGIYRGEQPGPVDSFCQTYVQTVTSRAELDAVKRLPRQLRDRIQGNDLDYLCRCLNWKDPTCQSSTGP
jgi:hypothetical protein